MTLFDVRNVLPLLAAGVLLASCKDTPTGTTTNPPPVDNPVPSLPQVQDTAAVVFFSELDAENGGAGTVNYTVFRDWNVVEGCVDLHGNGFFDVLQGNGLYIDLDGTCQNAGTLESKNALSLSPGTYILEFWLAGNQRIDDPDLVKVSLTGTSYAEEFRVARSDPFELKTRNITVSQTTSARIRFEHAGGDDQGILLDLVRLRRK